MSKILICCNLCTVSSIKQKKSIPHRAKFFTNHCQKVKILPNRAFFVNWGSNEVNFSDQGQQCACFIFSLRKYRYPSTFYKRNFGIILNLTKSRFFTFKREETTTLRFVSPNCESLSTKMS